ncbi:MAG: ferritin-like domain-containing protein [Deltaproteobacteria bacterium]|nr:ferritin-like domain-containing protein [Deltaproteobacteria bacterium]
MTTDTQLTVEGIIKFAINIEEESARFYENAINKYLDEDNKTDELIALLEELSLEEIKHKKRLSDRFSVVSNPSASLESDALRNVVDMIVTIPALEGSQTPVTVLTTALKRENATADLYRTLLSLSDLGSLSSIFEELVDQEVGHARRVKSLLEKMK